MGYLLDTNILSEARRPAGDPRVRGWLGSVPQEQLYLSVMVVGEIRQGVERLRHRDSAQADVIERWLGRLATEYADRLLPVTREVAEEWGRLNAVRPLPVVDGLLAVTARVHGLTLATRNARDVAGTGVSTWDPCRT